MRVTSDDCNRPEAQATGARFVGWKRAPNRKDRSRESQAFRDWAAATPQEGLLSVIRDVWCGPSLAYAQDVIEELEREPVDLVVTFEAHFGVMAGCESRRQRFAILGTSISLAPLPGVPPLGPGLPPARNDAERELLATSRAFDFPSESLPIRVGYVGPQLGDPQWTQSWASPWPASDDRPLVSVSFSTTFQNHAGALQRVIDALAPLPVRVIVTLGCSIEAQELCAANNCVVVESAPHSVVIREAAFVVTHGGHGTVMRALASRTPMLVIPHGRDQADNAVRVTERGAGLSLSPDASLEAIRTACERLLRDPSFRESARKLGDLVAAEAEGSTVVAELEGVAAGAAT